MFEAWTVHEVDVSGHWACSLHGSIRTSWQLLEITVLSEVPVVPPNV